MMLSESQKKETTYYYMIPLCEMQRKGKSPETESKIVGLTGVRVGNEDQVVNGHEGFY